jgi:hypothetical protein
MSTQLELPLVDRKKYRTRAGEIVTLVSDPGSRMFPFDTLEYPDDVYNYSYTEQGTVHGTKGDEHENDLIERVKDLPDFVYGTYGFGKEMEKALDQDYQKLEAMGVFDEEEDVFKVYDELDKILEETNNPVFNKGDQGKPPLAILRDFPEARKQVAYILTAGAEEYGRKNWKNVPCLERYTSAFDRHIDAYHNGEVYDQKSGYHHLAHAISNLFFMCELDLTNEQD